MNNSNNSDNSDNSDNFFFNNQQIIMDDNSYIQTLIQDTVGNEPVVIYKNIITEQAKKLLIRKIYKSSEQHLSDSKCPIMQREFIDGDEITCLPCNHYFLTESINRWLNEESCYCPVCKYKLDSYEKRIETESQANTFFDLLRRSYNPLLNSYLTNILEDSELNNEENVVPPTSSSQETTPLLEENAHLSEENAHLSEENIDSENMQFTNNLISDIYREIINRNLEIDIQTVLLDSYRND